ncbi:hypothetical protein [Paraburkholderia bryophila]|jgi:hypothetical protein|uniref:DNA repair protein n=1 Tax=Paraburkholderia bryophila TaxID=420952 RepID=A0A329CXT8_9BURK|nr:hypothetical protein [Paraburkholderia bryophila]RAS38957.1 hypothetical protein BX591_101287 [Paraburkholderia bryophila]
MKTVRHGLLGATLAGALLLLAGSAHAQSIEDKLRTQLRATTQTLRQLQDNQAQLQADKATAEQQRDAAQAQLKEAQAQLAAAIGKSSGEAAAQRALSAEKSSHAQDAQQLAKYKSSYEELLTVSRARDAQRSQLQSDVKQRDTRLQMCQSKNADLYRVGHEILDAYEHLGFGSFFASRQPFAQSSRVKYDEIEQRYGDALYSAQYDPAARSAGASQDAASAPAAAP